MQTKDIEPRVLDLRVCFLSTSLFVAMNVLGCSLGFTSIGTYASRRKCRNHPWSSEPVFPEYPQPHIVFLLVTSFDQLVLFSPPPPSIRPHVLFATSASLILSQGPAYRHIVKVQCPSPSRLVRRRYHEKEPLKGYPEHQGHELRQVKPRMPAMAKDRYKGQMWYLFSPIFPFPSHS
jgi:hypothetical protein